MLSLTFFYPYFIFKNTLIFVVVITITIIVIIIMENISTIITIIGSNTWGEVMEIIENFKPIEVIKVNGNYKIHQDHHHLHLHYSTVYTKKFNNNLDYKYYFNFSLIYFTIIETTTTTTTNYLTVRGSIITKSYIVTKAIKE